jgi:hypothetical protein
MLATRVRVAAVRVAAFRVAAVGVQLQLDLLLLLLARIVLLRNNTQLDHEVPERLLQSLGKSVQVDRKLSSCGGCQKIVPAAL